MARGNMDGLRATSKAAGLVVVLALVGIVGAAPPPDYGFDWATITHPGNRVASPSELSFDPGQRVGRVDHLYRISRTEMPNERWFEFVQAYAPYYDGTPINSSFTGHNIQWTGTGYEMVTGTERLVATVAWRYAARFANWLHNDKRLDQAAFESGAYDTSTFTSNPDGSINDQIAHTPGARFWIATDDEWVKAMYFDPEKNGAGSAGYWRHPISRDTPATPGLPWEGGETSAGIMFDPNIGDLPVAAYLDITSPWGLWDGSGGAWEVSESLARRGDGGFYRGARQRRGSAAYLDPVVSRRFDELGRYGLVSPDSAESATFRIASVVPGEGVLACGLCGWLCLGARRRS